jgi:hypothetical protein
MQLAAFEKNNVQFRDKVSSNYKLIIEVMIAETTSDLSFKTQLLAEMHSMKVVRHYTFLTQELPTEN